MSVLKKEDKELIEILSQMEVYKEILLDLYAIKKMKNIDEINDYTENKIKFINKKIDQEAKRYVDIKFHRREREKRLTRINKVKFKKLINKFIGGKK